MLSRFFAKTDSPEESTHRDAAKARRGIAAMDDDDAPAWGMWGKTGSARDTTPVQMREGESSAPGAGAPPAALLTPEQQMTQAMALIAQHHERIANTIRTLWGYKECGVYLNKLIMAGGDGMGQSSVSFNRDTGKALFTLSDLHDREFGSPDTSEPGSKA